MKRENLDTEIWVEGKQYEEIKGEDGCLQAEEIL